MTGLTAGTQYNIEIGIDGVQQDSITFTTLQNPTLSSIIVSDVTINSATINYTYKSNFSIETPNVEYKLNSGDWKTADTQPTTDGNYTISLTDLNPNTEYAIGLRLNGTLQGVTTFDTFPYTQDSIKIGTIDPTSSSATIYYTYTQRTDSTHGSV